MLTATAVMACSTGGPVSAAEPGESTLAVRLSPVGNYASAPSVVIDEDGFATAAWAQVTPGREDLWGSHYDPTSGWQPPVLLEHNNLGGVVGTSGVAMALCGDGSVVLVWSQENATQDSIWSARSLPDHSWEGAVLVETFAAGDGQYPQVGCDGAGNAVAVWYQSDGVAYSVAANRYTAGVGWGNAAYLEATNQQIYRPFVAVEPGGNATALWSQYDGAKYTVYANKYTVGASWGAPVPVEQDNVQTAYAQGIGGGPDGTFLAVGQFMNGSQRTNWLSHYAPGSGWGPLMEFDADAQSSPEVSVAPGRDGQWMLAWVQSDANGTLRFLAGEVAPGAALANVSLIRHHNLSQARFAASAAGGAVAMWQESDGGPNQFLASRLTPDDGWSSPVLVFRSTYHIGIQGAAAINLAGDAVFAMESFVSLSSTSEVWAASLFEPYAPALTLTAPAEGASTGLPNIRVAGTTEVGATVRANGVEAAVDSAGSFEALVPLKPGANLIAIGATDARGNLAQAWVNVTFNDPVPVLTAQLAAANADVAAALQQVNESQTRLATLEADANSTQADLEAARANLTAAQTQVTALSATATTLQADLNAAIAAQAAAAQRIATLEGNLANTTEALNASEDRIDALEDRPAGGDSGLALILAAVAIAVGVSGLAAALVMGGRGGKTPPK